MARFSRQWMYIYFHTIGFAQRLVLQEAKVNLGLGYSSMSCSGSLWFVFGSSNKKWRHIRQKSRLSGKIKFEFGISVLPVIKIWIFRNRPDVSDVKFDHDKQNFVFFLVISFIRSTGQLFIKRDWDRSLAAWGRSKRPSAIFKLSENSLKFNGQNYYQPVN